MRHQHCLIIGVIVILACLAACAAAANLGTIRDSSLLQVVNKPAPPARLPQSKGASHPAAASGPYDEKADAAKDIASASARARSDRKNVLLDFGANWCLDCVVLSKIFEDKSVKPYLDANFHVVKIDIGRGDKNLDLVKKYGNPIEKGVPAVVVLDPAERIITSTKGGELESARTATVQDILDYLKKWAPHKP